MKRILVLLLFIVPFASLAGAAFNPGDRVKLVASHASGVPVRDDKADRSYYRWPDGTEAVVQAVENRWLQVAVGPKAGWVLAQYVRPVVTEEAGEEITPLTVVAWNLEYYHETARRGFPEYLGAVSLLPRTEADHARIADAIRDDLKAAVVLLSEINGVMGERQSRELAMLVRLLGPQWRYHIGITGGQYGKQRVAILYDDAQVEALLVEEIPIPKQVVQQGDIFDRDPLVGYFRARRSTGPPATDFLVVSLHLASGQDKAANHNAAMARLRTELQAFCAARPELQGEREVLLGGDLNASRYDRHREDFWTDFDREGWNFAVLAPEFGDEYPGTRVALRPLRPHSKIDYFLASEAARELLVLPYAQVHQELVGDGDFYQFRLLYSDHFPISVKLKVGDDRD